MATHPRHSWFLVPSLPYTCETHPCVTPGFVTKVPWRQLLTGEEQTQSWHPAQMNSATSHLNHLGGNSQTESSGLSFFRTRFVHCINYFPMEIPPLYLQFCLALTKRVCCWHSICENVFMNNLLKIQLLFAAGMDSLGWSFSTPSFYGEFGISMSISQTCYFKILFMC